MFLFIPGLSQDASKIDYNFWVGDRFDNNITSEMFTFYIPRLEITEIMGGFGMSADIKNNGETEVTDIGWSIDLSGFLLFGEHSEGTISLAPGETKTISTGLLFGFGPTTITVIADIETKTANGFILGPFAIGIT